MNKVFDAYATYYDLFYTEKDYDAESAYIDFLLQRYYPNCHELLELGSGTGGHAIRLAERGYRLTGVDISNTMIERARHRAESSSAVQALDFHTGDLRSYTNSKTYDAVLALFHVMSYQTTDSDLESGFQTASKHLKCGGLFIFDYWYGPGVISDPPSVRIREVNECNTHVIRTSVPNWRQDEHIVDVNFNIQVEHDGAQSHIEECHSMRYLFLPEILTMLRTSNFIHVASHKWLTHNALDDSTWYGCTIARRA